MEIVSLAHHTGYLQIFFLIQVEYTSSSIG